MPEIDRDLAAKVLGIVDAGLIKLGVRATAWLDLAPLDGE